MNHLQNSNLIAAAIGVTVGVISAASIFIYHKILENQQHTTTTSNLDAANKKIAELQAELEAIRQQQSQQKKKRKGLSRKYASNDSTYTATDNDTDIDAFSTADTDVGDDEFYDCSDSESVIGDNDIRISEAMNHLDLVLNEIDEHADEEFEIKTYYKLQTLVKSQSDNVDVVWRFARICYKYSQYTSDSNTKKAVILEGIAVCEPVLTTHDAELYKWYAILIGLNGEYMSIADKIKNGYRFKDYITMALEMHPNDSQLHHLLGRFRYEVASLSWFERKIATTLFSEPPSASYEDAIDSFEQAEKLGKKPHLENRLFLSKSYIALSLYQKAIDWLDKALELPALTTEEKNIRTEASKLLNKYSGYRL